MTGTVERAPQADVIVALGCRIVDGVPGQALSRRVELAARAYRERVAPTVVVSGGRTWGGMGEATAMRALLVRLGVPECDVQTELGSQTTRENAVFTARWMRAHGHRAVLIATCRWHLDRATRAFRRCGVEVVETPSAWLIGPPASLALRARERVAPVLVAAAMADPRKLR